MKVIKLVLAMIASAHEAAPEEAEWLPLGVFRRSEILLERSTHEHTQY